MIFVIFASTAVAYKTNFINMRRETHFIRRTGTIIALELKNIITGSADKPVCVPILMYHSVNDNPVGEADLSVKTEDFDEQMKYLSDNGYTPIDIDDLRNAGKFNKPIILTFDDGYADNYKNAYPILKKYNFKATIFMVSGFINSPGFLNEGEMHEMEDIISFQSHTNSHRPLPKLGKDEIDQEMLVSKEKIYKVTDKTVDAISYPEGAFNPAVLKAAAKYYSYAVTTKTGCYITGEHKLSMKRIAVSRFESLQDFSSEISQ